MADKSFQKLQFRKQLSQLRKNISTEQRQVYSKQIMLFLFEYLEGLDNTNPFDLLVYNALPFEVDTSALLTQNRYRVFMPRMLPSANMEWLRVDADTQWKKADFGVMEPIQGALWQMCGRKTVLISPLLGFDRAGNRLGMGKGFFDRWLSKHADALETRVGLAFSCQELPKVPIEPHDAPLSRIITEFGVIRCQTP